MEMDALSSMPLGGLGPLESLPPCLELEVDWENYEPEKPGHLFIVGDAVSNNMEGPGLFTSSW